MKDGRIKGTVKKTKRLKGRRKEGMEGDGVIVNRRGERGDRIGGRRR